MGELKFIGKRVVYLAVMLFGVATLVFILTKMIPGDPVVANLSQRALNDPEIVAAYRAKHGLDRPLIVQYIYYIRDLLHFDLGTSIRTSRPVLDDLARCYPATLELALFSIVIASVFGILFGIISAIRRNSILDQIVRAISVTGVSIPAFWFALLMLYFFYYKLKIFPGTGPFKQFFLCSGFRYRNVCDRQPDRRKSGKSHGCRPSPDPSKYRFSSLYHGPDHQNHPF